MERNNNLFGAPRANARFPFNAGSNSDDREKTQLWLNVGYPVEIENADGSTESRFVSLPVGIPVDTTEALASNSSNDLFRMFTDARNDLLADLQTEGAKLAPGQELVIDTLQLQLRRVAGEKAATPTAQNPFARKAITGPADEPEVADAKADKAEASS